MRRIAWQAITKRGPGRWSSNHHTVDDKTTLCGKRIPEQIFRNDSFSEKDCVKCLRRRDEIQVAASSKEEKVALFKEVVKELGGEYRLEDGEHRAVWDAYGDYKNIYIAYGRLSGIGVWLMQNWLYLPLKEYATL